MKIEILDEVSSTNEYIKRYLSSGEDRIVVARRQTGGKGTKGRSFLSEKGGVYLSALTFYSAFPAKDAFEVVTHAAVAACRTAEAFNLFPQIKWPNDLVLNGKKLAGILVENVLERGFVRSSVVGIGLNVANDVSELKGIATSLSLEGARVSPDEVQKVLIEKLAERDNFEDYLSRVKFLGGEVLVTENATGERYTAVAERIIRDGRLCVLRAGEETLLSAAEISLRI